MGIFGDGDDDSQEESIDVGTPIPADDIQQWEYKIVDLREESENEGFMSNVMNEIQGPGLPPEDALNKLGEEGWELIQSVEKPGASTELTSTEGSMTYALIFRRPVSYQDR